MALGTMFGDIVRSLFRRPATRRYPVERTEAPARLRGRLLWNPAECVGCALCSKECPSNAIELITLDKKAKRFVVHYHLDRCIFCAQCVENCRFSSVELSPEIWEMAALHSDAFEYYYGAEEDIAEALQRQAEDAEV
jgi:formate hydrogenlyase subunit 6/NADH:ubiquinone oxidoreductase subunit I